MLSKGFTLTELMIALAVGAILLTLTVPSYNDLINRNKVTMTTNNIIGGLNYARTEAARTGRFVSFCPSNAAGTACVGNTTDWQNGFLVYYSDVNGNLANANDILRSYTYDDQITIVASPVKQIIYTSNGFLQSASAPYINVGYKNCPKADGRRINITFAGAAHLTTQNVLSCN